MRLPTRVLGMLTFGAMLLAVLVIVRWNGAQAQAEVSPSVSSSSQVAASGGGPMLRLAGEPARAAVRQLVSIQDTQESPLLVGRDCPAILLEDGSVSVWVTVSSAVPLTSITVFDDVGTPSIFEDDLPLLLVEGDIDVDTVLDPGELWVFNGVFFPAAGAIGDSVSVSAQDEALAVVTGFAACEFLPTPPPPPVEELPTEVPIEPTATAVPTEEPPADTSFTAAEESGPGEGSFTIAADGTPTVTKSSPTSQVAPGGTVTFTIDVVNPGPDPMFNVEVFDHLEFGLGLSWQIVSQTGEGSCDIDVSFGDTALICDLGLLSADEAFQVQIASNTNANTCGRIENVTELSWASDDVGFPDSFLQTEPVVVDIGEGSLCPRLVVEKEANADGIIDAGRLAFFTVSVRAVQDVFDVFVVDTLPDDLGWIVQSPDDECSVTGDEVFCSIGNMEAGEVFDFSVERSTTSADCGDLVNTAHAEEDSGSGSFSAAQDEDPATDDATITVLCPEVRVEQSPDLAGFTAGDDAVFTVTVHNDGPGRAFTTELDVALNPDVVWTDDFEDGEAVGFCDIVASTLSCTFSVIPAGGNIAITLTGETGPEDCTDSGIHTATVSAANEPSSAAGNNTDTVEYSIHCGSVSLTKSAADETVSAGSTATYQMTVENNGPGDAIGVELTDALPNGVTWTVGSIVASFSIPEVECEIELDSGISEQFLRCGVERVPAGENFGVFVSGTTSPENCDSALSNSAVATAENDGNVDVPPSESATITVVCPDLSLTKTAADAEISAGETASYTLTAANEGPGDAFDVVLTDTLPAGITWQEAPDNPNCAITGNALRCEVDTLAAPDSIQVTVEGSTGAEDCGDLSNSASLAASNHDPVDHDPVIISVLCPDLRVVKSTEASEVTAGQSAAFTIEVINDGEGNLSDVVLTDTLPAGVAWVESPDTLCTITGQQLRCEVGTLGPAGSDTDSFSVTVEGTTDPADCAAPLANSATVTSSNHASVTSDTVSITVECPALAVAKTGNGPISAGGTASYEITVTNSGPGIATSVRLRDTLPAGVEWTEASDDCEIDGPVLSCAFGDLATGGSGSVTISGATGPEDCGVITNTAMASADNHDEVSSTAATITVNCPDLLVTKEAGDAEISAGESASYAITVSNIGAGTATGVTVADTPPAGIAWTDNSADCGVVGGVLNCDFGDLGPTESASVTISGASGPEDCGEISNTATADATNDDPVTTDPAIITILCPGVAMAKVADAAAVAAGDGIGFTLTVSNPQVGSAFGVSMTDELPDVAGLSWTIDGGTNAADCAIDGGVLSCDFGTLPGGQSRTVHIASPTTAESCGTVENTATTEADNEPGNLGGNNTATASVAVDCASISLVKLATDGLGTEILTADVGDTITYLYVVANTGAVPLTDVSVLDDHFPVEGNLCLAGTTLEPNDGVAGSGPDEIVCAGEFLVGEIDITDADGLTLTNVATVTGVSPLGDEVTATDNATVTINEPKEPCEFAVTFTFVDDIDFVDEDGNVLFTMPTGLIIRFDPGAINEQGGCTMPFTILDPNGNSLATGTMSIYQTQLASAGVRALVTAGTLVVEVTEVTAWVVPGVPAPEPEVEEVKATIIVSGPVLQVEAEEAKAIIIVDPEIEVPFVKTEAYTISKPETPNTGAGVTATSSNPFGAIGGLATVLPALAAAIWYRRRAFVVSQWRIAMIRPGSAAVSFDEHGR